MAFCCWLCCQLLVLVQLTLLVPTAQAQNPVASNMQFQLPDRGSVLVQLPRLLGTDAEVLQAAVDSSKLRCGRITRTTGFFYNYTANPNQVDPLAGCTDTAVYSLSDGKGLVTSATLTFFIGRFTGVNTVVKFTVSPASKSIEGPLVTYIQLTGRLQHLAC